jgi:cellulose synthase operon protein B
MVPQLKTLRALGLLALAVTFASPADARTNRVRASGPDADLGSAGSGEVRVRDMQVKEDLGRPGDVTMVGIHAYGSLNFGIPEHWDVQGDPELHLDIVRSQQLLPDVSALTIWVDGRPVGTVPLDGEAGTIDREVVKIPLSAEEGFHTVTFLAYQRSRLPCELSDHPGLWSRVLDSSFIRVNYKDRTPEYSLADWPYPFRDERDPDPSRVVLVLPKDLSAEEAKTAAYVSSLLGNVAGWRPLDLYVHKGSPSTAPAGHMIAIAREDAPSTVLSEVKEVLSNSGNADLSTAGSDLRKGAIGKSGLLTIQPRPGQPERAMLSIIGSNGRGLEELATLLSTDEARRLPTGSVEYVEGVKAQAALEPRIWQDTVPPETEFTLSDLGLEDRMATGYRGGVVSIPLNMIPDDHPIAGQARLELSYSYAAQADTEHSRLDVYLNGAAAGGTALRDVNGRNRVELLLELPVHEMGPESRLDVAFTLVDKEEHRCLGDNRVEMWGTVHSDTKIKLPRDRWSYVPDLSQVRFGGYPFGIQADYTDSVFLLRADPSRTELQLFAWMAAEFGRVSRGDRFNYDVMIGDLERAKSENKNIVLVDSGPQGDLIQKLGLLGTMSFTPKGTPGISLALAAGGMVALGADSRVAYIEQVVLPWNKDRSGIVAYAADATLFERVGRCLDGASLFDRLRGKVTRVTSCQDVAAIPAQERQLLGQKPLREQAYEPIRNNYWLLFAGMGLGIIIMLAARGFWNSLGSRRDYDDDEYAEYGEG